MLAWHYAPLLWALYAVNALSILRFLPQYVQHKQLFLHTSSENIERENFDIWLVQQKDIAFNNILKNIGGISPVLDTAVVPPGVVLASPSKVHPNYYYQWIRDLALTIRSLVYDLADGSMTDMNLSGVVEAYIVNNYHIQRTPNLSGDFESLDGLGEPKFHPNLSSFNENWGRPQRDGPGLRVSTIGAYIGYLEKFSREPTRKELPSRKYIYHNIIKPDLKYIIKSWNQEGFDLWEEVNGFHFFTLITQLRALFDGQVLYKKYDGEDPEFLQALEKAIEDLGRFISQTGGFVNEGTSHIVENPSLLKQGKIGGLDTATLLGALHGHRLENKDFVERYQDIPFDIDSSHILNSLASMVADMKVRYPVNKFKSGMGVALGRYPEDIYDGYATTEGNPWFISTASASEILYRMIYKLNYNQQDIVIDENNRSFFSQFLDMSRENVTRLKFGSDKYKRVVLNLLEFADSFLSIVKDHVDDSGRMSEQFNRYDGYMQGAEDLTWSYSAIWNGIRWRQKALAELDETY